MWEECGFGCETVRAVQPARFRKPGRSSGRQEALGNAEGRGEKEEGKRQSLPPHVGCYGSFFCSLRFLRSLLLNPYYNHANLCFFDKDFFRVVAAPAALG